MPSMFEQAIAMEAEERRQAKRGYVPIENYQALQARCAELKAAMTAAIKQLEEVRKELEAPPGRSVEGACDSAVEDIETILGALSSVVDGGDA